ncbi:cellulase [Trifolium repens]|nr:cellulase [Trifolium repens]
MTVDKEMSSTAASDASKFMTENQAENSPSSMPTTEPPPQTIDQGDKDQCGNVQNNKKRKVTEASTKTNDVSNAEQPADSHKNGTSNLANHLRIQCKKFPKNRDPSQTVLSLQDSKGTGSGTKMNMLVFIAVNSPRCKFQFVSWGLNKYYDKEVADTLGCKVMETLTRLFESYSGKGQEESVAQEVEGSQSVPRSNALSQFE